MSKPVKLSEQAVTAIESEMRPRETYSQTIERLLKELTDFRATVRIVRFMEHRKGATDAKE